MLASEFYRPLTLATRGISLNIKAVQGA